MTDKTSAVAELRDAPWVSEETYKALLDRVIDAPVDADGNLLHVGDEYSVWPNRKRVHVIEELSIDDDGRWYITFQRMPQGPDVTAYCSQVYKVVPDSRERIEADARLSLAEYCDKRGIDGLTDCNTKPLDLVRRCFALMDGEHQ